MLGSEASAAGHLGSTDNSSVWSHAATVFGLTVLGLLVLSGLVIWFLHVVEERRLARCRRADRAVEPVTVPARRAVLDFQVHPRGAIDEALQAPGDPISAPDAGRVTGLHSRRRRTAEEPPELEAVATRTA